MTASELMTALGYECLGRDPAAQDCQLWLKQCGPRGLLVTLLANAPAFDVAEAIHNAGARDKHDEIAGRWRAFTDALKFPGVSEVWARARELQAQQFDAMALAGSMPKQPPTVKL
jgi:hypothetical protein